MEPELLSAEAAAPPVEDRAREVADDDVVLEIVVGLNRGSWKRCAQRDV